jgi:hypothetical protein
MMERLTDKKLAGKEREIVNMMGGRSEAALAEKGATE